MRRRLGSHLTYANVISTLALFLVLGGGTALAAYVVNSNSDVAPGTISGHKPPSGAHANIIAGSVNGFDVADGSVSGTDITESTLGKVPNADKLDGVDSAGLIHGPGRIVTYDQTVPVGNDNARVLFSLPGLVQSFTAFCAGRFFNGAYDVQAPANASIDVVSDQAGQAPSHQHIPANEVGQFDTRPGGESWTFSFETGGKVATVHAFSYAFHNPVLNDEFCQYTGQMIVRGA